MLEFRDKAKTASLVKEIKKITPKREIGIMHVCGTHEMTIARFGLRKILPKNIKLISGPGCPVCVTSAEEIDYAIRLAKEKDVILTTFGDMLRVPGSTLSLSEAKSEGADVRVIYGVQEVAKIAKKTKKEVVHFSIGFETTAPLVANEILENKDLKNLSIICSHRLIPPAMEYLLSFKDIKIDGFICPGHVSTIIGTKPYQNLAKKFKKPMVISGFEPNDVLFSVLMILRQIKRGEAKVENEYQRAVKKEGNVFAKRIMERVFEVCSKGWRGIGKIPNSGLKLKKEFSQFDAQKKFAIKIKKSKEIKPGCKCGEILKGRASPKDCPYFGKICTPYQPLGPCMISIEGSCYISYNYPNEDEKNF